MYHRHRLVSFVVVSAFVACFTSRLEAQTAPDHVRESLGKLVGQWDVTTVVGDNTSRSEIIAKLSPDGSSIIYHWEGTDFVTGKTNKGTGIIGWDAAKKLVVEFGIDGNGGTFTATHHISENGDWVSPTNGSSPNDGQVLYTESLRIFKWNTPDQWRITSTHYVAGGEQQSDIVGTFQRKSK